MRKSILLLLILSVASYAYCLSPEETYKQGVEAYNGGDFIKSVRYLRTSCIGGVMMGCLMLGIFYEESPSSILNYANALEYYKKACDGGLEEGCRRFKLIH